MNNDWLATLVHQTKAIVLPYEHARYCRGKRRASRSLCVPISSDTVNNMSLSTKPVRYQYRLVMNKHVYMRFLAFTMPFFPKEIYCTKTRGLAPRTFAIRDPSKQWTYFTIKSLKISFVHLILMLVSAIFHISRSISLIKFISRVYQTHKLGQSNARQNQAVNLNKSSLYLYMG